MKVRKSIMTAFCEALLPDKETYPHFEDVEGICIGEFIRDESGEGVNIMRDADTLMLQYRRIIFPPEYLGDGRLLRLLLTFF